MSYCTDKSFRNGLLVAGLLAASVALPAWAAGQSTDMPATKTQKKELTGGGGMHNSMSGNVMSDNAMSGSMSDNSMSGNVMSGNSMSDNSMSGMSENSMSGNSMSDNSMSGQ